jgi:hypothetical protein
MVVVDRSGEAMKTAASPHLGVTPELELPRLCGPRAVPFGAEASCPSLAEVTANR